MNYHSRRLKKTKTIILKKSKKSDYTDSKFYRLIILLDILSKVFETVIAVRLRDCTEINSLLSEE